MTKWHGPNGYWVSDERSLINVDLVHHWLTTQSYWARNRSYEVVEKSIEGSLNLGLFSDSGAQVGFCRWVTDEATFGWLCDVFVDPNHRGNGLGVFLVNIATQHPAVSGLRLLLGTGDAHELYAKFGFTPIALPDRMMEVWPDRPSDSR